ncbi:hypothetical protein B0H17DRAFT_1088422 [Mycena rosella]|uniref:Uncharacterized protein n=1 Tax=Mycena rosella TaxID=1033263 RepID=A0AAD7CX93_MYCRO|nr:hypothetical protein B0H17DRAFT_1088422 [Mycena rosella]
MLSFTSFGVPIVFAGILLVSMTVGVACMWGSVWHRRPWQSEQLFPDAVPETPKLWDLFTDDLLDSKYADATWGSLQPFSVARVPDSRPENGGSVLVPLQRMQRAKASQSKVGDKCNSASHDLLQIAVAISMPCAQRSARNAHSTDGDWQPDLFCIGLRWETVAELDV